MIIRALALLTIAGPAAADALVPIRTIPSKAIISATDLVTSDLQVAGALTDVAAIDGMEARVTLYAGRPVRPGDVAPAAVIERNQIVSLIYSNAALRIETEGRALDRAAPGDRVRVMNLSSRSVVVGAVTADGSIEVGR